MSDYNHIYDWETHCAVQASHYIPKLEEELRQLKAKHAALVEAAKQLTVDCFNPDLDMLIHPEDARPENIIAVVAVFLERFGKALTNGQETDNEGGDV